MFLYMSDFQWITTGKAGDWSNDTLSWFTLHYYMAIRVVHSPHNITHQDDDHDDGDKEDWMSWMCRKEKKADLSGQTVMQV